MNCSSLSRALLILLAVKLLVDTVHCRKHSKSQRWKREWVIPSKRLMENVDYTKESSIARIGSDLSENLRYSLKGPGASQPPYNLFVVDEKTGNVRITGILDREKTDKYNLVGVAWYANGTTAEEGISLPFKVEDQNDNPPVFVEPEPASVYEGSPVGTVVTQVAATDADLANSAHTKIAFSIIKQEPDSQQFFYIDKHSGHIRVKDPSLDRETQNSYVLTVKATDMDGAPGGNTATTTVKIHILDINDNVPTLEKDEYTGSVDEHVADVEVLRIQALDKDEEKTDNWLAVFQLASGNEDGYFNFITDPDTNEGVLYLVKPIDFEAVSNLDLEVFVENKAPEGAAAGEGSGAGTGAGTGTGAGSGLGSGTGDGAGEGQGPGTGAGEAGRPDTGGKPITPGAGDPDPNHKTYMLKIKVNDTPDGPKYDPNPKVVAVSENTKGVIAAYPAMDGDTGKQAEKVRYAKGHDPANWLSIDENTAEIKLNKMPDRESPHVVNGTYYAKILCITDEYMPSVTATGTIALEVEDINDNCPTLLSTTQHVCSDVPELNVTAVDADVHPNSAPFQFLVIPEETRGKWSVRSTSAHDEAAVLVPQESLWPGAYRVTMVIKDQQGFACPDKQVLQIEVCTCSEEGTCSHELAAVKTAATTSFGAPGIAILLLGFLILLLVPGLLLSCSCGKRVGEAGLPGYFIEMPFDTKEFLIPYHTEGQGEDREVPLLSAPFLLSDGVNVQTVPSNMAVNLNAKAPDTMGLSCGYDYAQTNTVQMTYNASKDDHTQFLRESDMALSDEFLEGYFTQKARYEAESAQLQEGLLVYDYEGKGSSAGSETCDSLLESFDDLEFLDDLGPKFTTLAQICGFTCPEIQLEAAPEAIPETKASFDMTTQMTCERSTEVASSSQVMKTSENTFESLPAPTVMSENLSMQSQMLVVQEPLYYMVEQVPSTVLLAGQASVEVGQGMYLVSGAERLILNQSYLADGKSSDGQQGALSGGSEKSINITSQHPNSLNGKSVLHQGSSGWMHQGSISGETGSEVVIMPGGHSVAAQTPGLNNGTLLNGEHVVIMEKATWPGHVVLGEALAGLNQTVVQNVSPTQNFIMVPGQLAPAQLKQERVNTLQMGFQGVSHRANEQNAITLVESPGQVFVGSQDIPAQLTPVKKRTLQRGVSGRNHGQVVVGTSEQNAKTLAKSPGKVLAASQATSAQLKPVKISKLPGGSWNK